MPDPPGAARGPGLPAPMRREGRHLLCIDLFGVPSGTGQTGH